MSAQIRIRPSPLLAVFLFIVAAIDGALYATGGGTLSLVFAIVFVFGGVTQWIGALMIVGSGRVEIKNPLGMTTRTLDYDRLKIAGRRLFVTSGERTFKVNGMLARRSDWRALGQAIDRDGV